MRGFCDLYISQRFDGEERIGENVIGDKGSETDGERKWGIEGGGR